MGRRGEDEDEGSGLRLRDARIVEEPSRRMTAAAVTLSRGCAERIRDGIGASTSEASASETRRARRDFADGGSATGTSSLRDDSGFISLTYTPRKPTATFLRASALDRAAHLMSTIYEEQKDEDGFLYITYSGENTFGAC